MCKGMKERYLTGEEICAYLHYLGPAYCRTYGTHDRYLSLLSVDATPSIPNPASAKPSSTICAMLKNRFNADRLFTMKILFELFENFE